MNNDYKTYEEMDSKERRDYWHRRVTSSKDVIMDSFEKEIKYYLKFFRNQFSDLLPEVLLKSDRVDVNVIYPIIKSMIPQLYFKDPQCFIKAEEEKVVIPQLIVNEETGEEQAMVDPVSGIPMVEEHDGPKMALILQNAINDNIRNAKLKQNTKMAIYDAELTPYGAIKTGWGVEQGVLAMGGEGFISHREDTNDGLAYGIRLKPWEVYPDLMDFYNQKWTACGYCVHPEVLKRDARLKNTSDIKGTAKVKENYKKLFKNMNDDDLALTEYYEVYVKPCSEYPQGGFLIISEEVKDDFLYEGPWPHDSRFNPIKFLYFNHDPEGGLPIPGVRYYINQQKMKSMTRKVAWEYSMRSIPFVVGDLSRCANKEAVKKAIQSGIMPKFIDASGLNPSQSFNSVSYPNLSMDFYKIDRQIDDDISRQTGRVHGVYPGSGENIELASVYKSQDSGEAIRQNEKSDIVTDFMYEILNQWVDYFKEYAGPENYTSIDGQKFPVKWSGDQIRLRTKLAIKPFSMNYEDPTIRRRQWADVLNLSIAPANIQALALQGAQMDVVKIWSRILESFDERDIEGFLIEGMERPEEQVARAIQELFDKLNGIPHIVQATDNHKIHILIHNMAIQMGVDMSQEIFAHQQEMLKNVTGTPGGGNKEGLPVNGNAVNQEQMNQPLEQSPANKKTAINREATKTR